MFDTKSSTALAVPPPRLLRVPSATSRAAEAAEPIRVDGKFFRRGAEKFFVKGVTYGPFRANSRGEALPEPARAAEDFRHLEALGGNTVRVYYPPGRWFLDLAQAHGLKVFVDIPWPKHICFIEDRAARQGAEAAVRAAVRGGAGHPAVMAYSVVNEIPPDVVRWLGPRAVERFIDRLVAVAKEEDPRTPITFANFPPTEYLHPRDIDFFCFNVYLHDREALRNYLHRLQNLVKDKPLMLGEYGIDAYREGADHQCELLGMHIEEVFRAGLAGTCIFSFTDEWFTGGYAVEDWAFGLTDQARRPRPAFERVAELFQGDPRPPLPSHPKVSVVVCSYNGAATLDACLSSLEKLRYPNYEVILVDDGSTDQTPEIAARHRDIKYIRQANRGLSVARNVGLEAAWGEIVAYTDSDCIADEDWLYYLVGKLHETAAVGVGGPNLPPPQDGPVAACVSSSPGMPCHILIDDQTAEHIPGCNMAFWARRLEEISGFNPVYTRAGDDVDICWRLQQAGHRIVYAPAAMVWHHRRSTVRAYLKQQGGYGEAEGLLKQFHPERFQGFRSDSTWHGVIYGPGSPGLRLAQPVIYHGIWGSGLFQTLYASRQAFWPMLALSLEWLLGTGLLFGLGLLLSQLLAIPLAMIAATLGVAVLAGAQAEIPTQRRRWWSRLLISGLYIAQPVARSLARYRARLRAISIPEAVRQNVSRWQAKGKEQRVYLSGQRLDLWSSDGVGRGELLNRLTEYVRASGWKALVDTGWKSWDMAFYGDKWYKTQLTTVTEEHGQDRRLTRLRLRTRPTLFYKALVVLLLFAAAAATLALSRRSFGGVPGRLVALLGVLPFLGLVWLQIRSVGRRLNRTVLATALLIAEDLGLTPVAPKPASDEP